MLRINRNKHYNHSLEKNCRRQLISSYINFQFDKSSEVDERSGVDRNFVKLEDESSVVVENTGLKQAVVYQRVFSH